MLGGWQDSMRIVFGWNKIMKVCLRVDYYYYYYNYYYYYYSWPCGC
jgi:hypothetical protein